MIRDSKNPSAKIDQSMCDAAYKKRQDVDPSLDLHINLHLYLLRSTACRVADLARYRGSCRLIDFLLCHVGLVGLADRSNRAQASTCMWLAGQGLLP